jgi:hypothetical protein
LVSPCHLIGSGGLHRDLAMAVLVTDHPDQQQGDQQAREADD